MATVHEIAESLDHAGIERVLLVLLKLLEVQIPAAIERGESEGDGAILTENVRRLIQDSQAYEKLSIADMIHYHLRTATMLGNIFSMMATGEYAHEQILRWMLNNVTVGFSAAPGMPASLNEAIIQEVALAESKKGPLN